MGILGEAHVLVDNGLTSDEDFAKFTFANSVRLNGRLNPGFFNGRVIEAQATAVLEANKA